MAEWVGMDESSVMTYGVEFAGAPSGFAGQTRVPGNADGKDHGPTGSQATGIKQWPDTTPIGKLRTRARG